MDVGICPLEDIDHRLGAEDVAFVVDALRASSTVVTLLDVGADAVIPVRDVGPKSNPDVLTIAEENGEPLPEADLGNSPTAVRERADRVTGARVHIQTTNGTVCVDRVRDAVETVGIASLLNRRAVATALADGELDVRGRVWFVPADRAGEYAPEDHFVAARLRDAVLERLDGATPVREGDERSPRDVFLGSHTGAHLTDLGARDDVLFCAREDECDVVPVLTDGRFQPLRGT